MVGSNTIFREHWVSQRCGGMKGWLSSGAQVYRCTGEIRPLEGRPAESVVDKFCYLDDIINVAGGVEESIVARIKFGWKKFREPLPLLTSKVLSLCTKGKMSHVCQEC